MLLPAVSLAGRAGDMGAPLDRDVFMHQVAEQDPVQRGAARAIEQQDGVSLPILGVRSPNTFTVPSTTVTVFRPALPVSHSRLIWRSIRMTFGMSSWSIWSSACAISSSVMHPVIASAAAVSVTLSR